MEQALYADDPSPELANKIDCTTGRLARGLFAWWII